MTDAKKDQGGAFLSDFDALELPPDEAGAPRPLILRSEDVSIFELNKPIPDELRTRMPRAGGGQLTIDALGISHFMFVPEPTQKEIELVTRGRVQVRMLNERYTLMLLFKYGAFPWLEGIFSAHRLVEEDRVFPPDPGEGMSWVMRAVMIDTTTGIVRAMRQLALSRKFSVAVLRAIEAQLALPADEAQHRRETKRMQGRPQESLANSAHIRFEQGETAS